MTDFTFCDKCQQVKPPRAHHCQVCGKCIIKMDHHCPFIGNCIGIGNHKLFWNFLIYACLGSFQTAISLLFSVSNIPSVIISLVVCISTGLLFIMNTQMFLSNTTCIESKALRNNPFDQGSKRNWVEVFGKGWFYKMIWVLPI